MFYGVEVSQSGDRTYFSLECFVKLLFDIYIFHGDYAEYTFCICFFFAPQKCHSTQTHYAGIPYAEIEAKLFKLVGIRREANKSVHIFFFNYIATTRGGHDTTHASTSITELNQNQNKIHFTVLYGIGGYNTP